MEKVKNNAFVELTNDEAVQVEGGSIAVATAIMAAAAAGYWLGNKICEWIKK